MAVLNRVGKEQKLTAAAVAFSFLSSHPSKMIQLSVQISLIESKSLLLVQTTKWTKKPGTRFGLQVWVLKYHNFNIYLREDDV